MSSYWMYGVMDDGRPVVLGPSSSEGEAYQSGAGLERVEVFKLPTTDKARATSMIKAKLVGRGGGGNWTEAMRRMSHQRPAPQMEQEGRRGGIFSIMGGGQRRRDDLDDDDDDL